MAEPISCCLIVKNEIGTIEDLLKQLRPNVDEIVVVDTGSTDGTLDTVKKYADKVEVCTEFNDEQGRITNFSGPRNKCLELATHDWVVWFDGDDKVTGLENLRKLTEVSHEDHKVLIYMVPYEYDHDAQGNVITLQLRERMVWPRKRFRWDYPVHELLVPHPPVLDEERRHTVEQSFRVIHRRDPAKQREPGRNLRLLEQHHKQVGDHDLRTLFYLGQEYAASGDHNYGKGFRCLKKYCVRSDWADERCLAEILIAKMYLGIGDCDSAIEWANRAKVSKSWSEPYFLLSTAFYIWALWGVDTEYNFKRSARFAEIGLAQPPEKTVLFFNPTARYEIHTSLNVCYAALGDYESALRSCQEGLRALPDNAQLLENAKKFQGVLSKREVIKHVGNLVTNGVVPGQVKDIVESVISTDYQEKPHLLGPGPAETSPVSPPTPVIEARDRLPVKGPDEPLDIVIYTGPALECWNPETLDEQGMGGSETMARLMSVELAKRGHAVTVYGDMTPDLEGNFDGVEWLNYDKYVNRHSDVLISSRNPVVLDNPTVSAVSTICWIHDIHLGPALDQRRDLRWDRYLALSNWHKEFLQGTYPKIDPDKIHVTRNGIELERFTQNLPREPHRAVYSSSPDRGLEIALRNWHRVREKVPDAELVVLYGFANWRKSAELMNKDEQMPIIEMMEKLVRETEGVIALGRVNRFELAQEFLRSGVWAYSTWFSETSCLTSMEAQAAGLLTVTSPIAALPETTAGGHCIMIDRDPSSEEYGTEWVNAVVACMLDPNEEERKRTQESAKRFDIHTLGDDWDKMIRELYEQMVKQGVQPYRKAQV